jgi:predicted phosphohydrolase
MKIVGISDLHERWHPVVIPECDLLISTGDYSFHGSPYVVKSYHEWLNKQPAKYIISGQGNHETWVEKNFEEARNIALGVCPRVQFVDEGPVDIEGLKIWYSAITPRFFNWAYNRERGAEIKAHWDLIPMDTKILLTHGPPYGILDEVPSRYYDGLAEKVGCHDLLARVKEIKPDLHMFGHIHPAHGEHHEDGTSFYNLCICNERYAPTNTVTVIDYELE